MKYREAVERFKTDVVFNHLCKALCNLIQREQYTKQDLSSAVEIAIDLAEYYNKKEKDQLITDYYTDRQRDHL